MHPYKTAVLVAGLLLFSRAAAGGYFSAIEQCTDQTTTQEQISCLNDLAKQEKVKRAQRKSGGQNWRRWGNNSTSTSSGFEISRERKPAPDKFDSALQEIHDLKQAAESDPSNKTYWYRYALALYKIGDCEFVVALAEYHELCARGAQCLAKNVKWSGAKVTQAKWSPSCWPHFVKTWFP